MKNLISIYLAICLSISLSGFGQVSKNEVSNYLIKKQIINENEVFQDNQLIELKKDVLEKKVLYYDFIYRTRPVNEKVRIGIFDNKIYAIPQDFNLLINDLDKHDLTKEQRVLMLLKIMLNPNDSIEFKKDIDTTIFNIKYKYKVITWSKINGIRSILYFSFEENKIRSIYEVIIDVFKGNYEINDNVITPGKGHHNIYNLFISLSNKNSKSQNVQILNYEGIIITSPGQYYARDNVVIRIGITPREDWERTIQIKLYEFGNTPAGASVLARACSILSLLLKLNKIFASVPELRHKKYKFVTMSRKN